ncbi:zinc finger protein 883 [Conger conger]|uniref:zinc finger protein 883 n=1 Tax=Conger conger TaxID=82655 RepID=UPI002A5996FB|nr:zinc finger protein 883 [Conger conger]
MDTVPCSRGTVVNEEDSSQLAKLEAQAVQQEKCQSLKQQGPKDAIRCYDSGQSFIELPGLLRHRQRDHTLRKPHRCQACGQEFALLSSLQLHKHSDATLSCQFCQRVFPCSTSLATHLLQQHRAILENQGLQDQSFNYHQNDGPYACVPCGRNFWQKPALLHHQQAGCDPLSDLRPWPHVGILTVSSLIPQAPTPPSLPSSAVPIASTSLPPAYVAPSPIRSHLCSLCPREFRSQAGLACHQRLSHPLEWKRAQSRFWKQGGDRFPCPSCDKVFCHSPSLSQHQARCHMRKVKRKTRTKHRRKSQFFPCRSCDMVFSQTSKLYLHRKEQHCRLEGDGKQRTARPAGQLKRKHTHPCYLCSKVFPDALSYWAHLKTHSGQQRRIQRGKMVSELDKEQQVDQRRLFQCPQCDKAYSHRCNLSRHLHTHSKIREKSDPVLGPTDEIGEGPAGKGGRSSIKGHQAHKKCQDKEDDGTFPCPSCEEVFSLHSALREHEEVHQSMGGGWRCSVCSHGLDSFRRMGRNVAGFYHCVPCKHAFQTLSVFLQHCQMHLLPRTDKEGGTDSSDTND